MGTPFLTAVGQPPVCTSLRFRPWCYDLLAYRLAECPITRGTTYYFSNSGDDMTGDGSLATPWATVAKANTTIAALASNANTAILFKRGDVWRERVTLTAAKNNITIGAYGTDASRPCLSWFTPVTAASWTETAGRTNVWEVGSITSDVAAVRLRDDTEIGFVQTFSLDDCEDTNGSWYYDGSADKLYLRPFVPSSNAVPGDPTDDGAGYEYCLDANMKGISATGDGIRVHGIRVDGAGCSARPRAGGNYEIYWTPATATDCFVMTDCECYYGDTHNFGTTTAGSGGIFTAAFNRAAWMSSTNAPSGGSISPQAGSLGVSYAYEGDQEAIFWGNRYGSAQMHGLGVDYSTVVGGGGGSFGHTSGGATRISLSLQIDEVYEESMNCCGAISGFDGAPEWTDLADCRSFVVNCRKTARGQIPADVTHGTTVYSGPLLHTGDKPYVMFINNFVQERVLYDSVNPNSTKSVSQGIGHNFNAINCVYLMDWWYAGSTSYLDGRYISTTAAAAPRLYNCMIQQRLPGPGSAFVSNQYASADWKIFNSIIAVNGTANTRINGGYGGSTNDSSHILNNFWAVDAVSPNLHITNADYGFEGDTLRTIVANFRDFEQVSATSPLISASQQLVFGYPLEYDINWRPRSPGATARGPWEFVRDPVPIQLTTTDFIEALRASSDFGTTGLLLDATNILNDTNELQTDLANGGRVDLLIDTTVAQTAASAIRAAQGLSAADLDTQLDAVLAQATAAATATSLTSLITAVRNLIEADQRIESDGVGGYVLKTYQRGTATELIPEKQVKTPAGTNLTDPSTQELGGYDS